MILLVTLAVLVLAGVPGCVTRGEFNELKAQVMFHESDLDAQGTANSRMLVLHRHALNAAKDHEQRLSSLEKRLGEMELQDQQPNVETMEQLTHP